MAESLIHLLRLALSLPSDDIRCTSVEGFRLPGGASTDDVLRQEVHEAELFIGLITPDSIQSAYVMFELGARWGAAKTLIPVLAAGATSGHLKGPLSGINALNCSIPEQVYQLLDDASRLLSVRTGSPAAYQNALRSVVAASNAHTSEQPITPRASSEPSKATPVASSEFTELEMELLAVFTSNAVDPRGRITASGIARKLDWPTGKAHLICTKLAADGLLSRYVGEFELTTKGARLLLQDGGL